MILLQFFVHGVQIGCEARSPPYPTGNRDTFPWSKVAAAWRRPSPSSIKIVSCLYVFILSYFIKHRENFTFTFGSESICFNIGPYNLNLDLAFNVGSILNLFQTEWFVHFAGFVVWVLNAVCGNSGSQWSRHTAQLCRCRCVCRREIQFQWDQTDKSSVNMTCPWYYDH
jgi:hypothetical protein